MYKNLKKEHIRKKTILTRGTVRFGNTYDYTFTAETLTEGGDAKFNEIQRLLEEFHISKVNRKILSLL